MNICVLYGGRSGEHEVSLRSAASVVKHLDSRNFSLVLIGIDKTGRWQVPGCHRVLKSVNFKGWLIVDNDIAREGPRRSYENCGRYVVNTLEPVYV